MQIDPSLAPVAPDPSPSLFAPAPEAHAWQVDFAPFLRKTAQRQASEFGKEYADAVKQQLQKYNLTNVMDLKESEHLAQIEQELEATWQNLQNTAA